MLKSLWAQFAVIHPVDWFAMLAGIMGVSLSIKERLSAWPFFILCYSAYIYISFRSGYYAFSAMNIGFVGIAVYGWCKWSGFIASVGARSRSLEVSNTSRKHWLCIILFVCIFTPGIGALIANMDAARLPYLDAFAVSNALVAQWMLSRKHIENWIFWIVSDVVYIVLFLNDKLWPSVILFSVFIVLACKGWYDWKQSMLRKAASPAV